METDILQNVWPEWKIEGKPLGKGSYGVVYKAVRRDHNVESFAAIKVISIPSDSSEVDTLRSEGLDMNATKSYLQGVVDDFVSEIQLMESFKGVQNIVSVEDYKVVEKKDEIGWDIFIRMELLTPLNNVICERALTQQEVVKLGVDICTALELCAKRNVIHRDIKPENIFVNQFGDFKLGDFGIARKLENVTGGLSQKGTYYYMAPEVERGNKYDATVDLYSLGLVLYRFTNKNRLPFLNTEQQLLNPNERMAAVRRRLNGEVLPPPCEATPELANVILSACAPDPKRRFSSAAAMKNALLYVGGKTRGVSPNGLNATVSVLRSPQPVDPNRTTSVRRAPEAQMPVQTNAQKPAQKPSQSTAQKPAQSAEQKPEQKPVNTFAKKKKSKTPAILAAVLVVALLIGGGIFLAPKLLGNKEPTETKERLQNGGEQGNTSVTAGIGAKHTTVPPETLGNDGYSNYDHEQITVALQEAAQYADSEDYNSALARIKVALTTYPKSEALQTKKDEYTAAIAAQEKANKLKEAEQLAAKGDYSGAIALMQKARMSNPDDADYESAYQKYQQEFFTHVKEDAVSEAEQLVSDGDYYGALLKIREAKAIVGTDSDLDVRALQLEDSYADQVSSQIDAFLADNDVSSAKTLAQEALQRLPNNELVKSRSDELQQYKTVLLSTLEPINGGFSWNDGTPGDPFGNDYSGLQNYAIFHGHSYYRNDSFSAEYKIDGSYQTLSMMLSPFSDFVEHGHSYVQVYVNSVLRYTSPSILQKTEPFRTPEIDVSDAEYIKIEVHIIESGSCLMLSDVQLNSFPSFESKLKSGITPITALNPFNGSMPWQKEYPMDTTGNDYTEVQNYAVLNGVNYWGEGTYTVEYYIAKGYKSISLDIAPNADFAQSGSSQVMVYAGDDVVYISESVTQKSTKFNTGEIDLTGTDYVKIVAKISGKGYLIISNVLLTDAE